jgi:hypothetical protein
MTKAQADRLDPGHTRVVIDPDTEQGQVAVALGRSFKILPGVLGIRVRLQNGTEHNVALSRLTFPI